VPPKDNRIEEVAKSIAYTLELVNSRKPNDKSSLDRIFAVTKNDLEHAYAYFIVGVTALSEIEAVEKEKEKNKRKD
jgi:hypothetical protein